MEEQRAVAGVFGVDVDLPRENGAPHDVGGPELHLVLDGDAVLRQQERDHVAEEAAFGVDLRGDDDGLRGGRAGEDHGDNGDREGAEESLGHGRHLHFELMNVAVTATTPW